MKRVENNAFTCPCCGGKTRSSGTQATDYGEITRERRCDVCGYSFVTIELDKDLVDYVFSTMFENSRERNLEIKRMRRNDRAHKNEEP